MSAFANCGRAVAHKHVPIGELGEPIASHGLAILVCVRLWRAAPASIEQGLGGGHAGRRSAALEPQTPVSVRMASAVCARAKERISAVALVI